MYVHIVFSTKHRQPFIKKDIDEELHKYIGGICKNLECNPIQIGGYRDHVHILCILSKKVALMTLVEKIKSNSSKWMKTKGSEFENFYWQNGYGAFSVSHRNVDAVVEYIQKQEEHHATKSFQDEFLKILKANDMEFDEKYVWD